MGLKGGRNITVGEWEFQWKFKAHKDNLTRFGQSPRFAHVAIHATEFPGKLLAQIESTVSIPDEGDIQCGSTHKARFSPADVRKLILAGIAAGWHPSNKTQFRIPPGIELADFCSL